MGWIKVKITPRQGRGTKSAIDVIDAMMDSWDLFTKEIHGINQEEQDEIKTYFNEFIVGEDDLGDILFGSKEDFEARLKFLLDEV